MHRVPLKIAAGSPWAFLRELCGYDELMVDGSETHELIRLLDRLLIDADGTEIGPGKSNKLTASDRDRLSAAVYMQTFGSRIESTVSCNSCETPFDIDFSLHELVGHLDSKKNGINIEKVGDGVFKLNGGCCFRLPTWEDECAASGMTPEKAESVLLTRCVLEGDPANNPQALQQAMEALAPVLDMDLDAHCPECNNDQAFHFDLQYYLLGALQQERNQVALEVHRLARAYGWSLKEILELPRSMRKTYVSLVESEIDAQRRKYQ